MSKMLTDPKALFLHTQDEQKRIVTDCLILEGVEVHASGRTICSRKDMELGHFSFEFGNKIALGRAVKALDRENDLAPVRIGAKLEPLGLFYQKPRTLADFI
jgi:hypothetical protein